MDTRVKPFVRIENGSLDESLASPGDIVLRGRVSPATLRFLHVDMEYQRGLDDRAEIFQALKEGCVVPDIDIGVRGQDYYCDGDDFVIRSPCYIIDGWQRVGTALRLLELVPDAEIRIGALLHFGTTQAWEAARFTALNNNSKRVSPSLHLRNLREQNPAVLTLYGLSENDGSSPLRGRVCWEQNMRREHLLPALQLAKTCLYLHRHVAPHNGVRAEAIAGGLQTAAARVGLRNFRQNCLTFFHVLEECFGVTSIEYKRAAPQIRGSFLLNLARLFSRHENFWDDAGLLLCVDSSWRRTLARFPMSDPHVVQLAGSGGPAMEILYDLMVKHMNSGKRTNRLIPREPGR